jgi:hypothetical protein
MAPSAATPLACFENEAARLLRHPAGFLHLTWGPGSASSTATRAVFEHLLRELRATGYGKVLSDQRQLAPPSDEDTAWYVLDWLPRALTQGYRYCAIISATHLFARLALHSIRQQAMRDSSLVYQHFDQEDLAFDWLIGQE